MMSSQFRIDEYTLPGQHIREYPGGAAGSQDHVLQLAIKRYTPLDSRHAGKGGITIIAAHATGYPKELFEAMFDELVDAAGRADIKIRSIWLPDVWFGGQSAVLNEGKLGNDPSWFDHSRDILHMVNHFREEMPRPIVGLGHSAGGIALAGLALMHPRLFTALILIEPVMSPMSHASHLGKFLIAQALKRRDFWDSRSEARDYFLRDPGYRKWHPKVLEDWIRYGLREVDDYTSPYSRTHRGKGVTLTTPTIQEAVSYVRPHFYLPTNQGGLTYDNLPVPGVEFSECFNSRPEVALLAHFQPYIRPSVLYVVGGKSPYASRSIRESRLANTGTGYGGSGGVKAGKVREVCFEKSGHLVPFEMPVEVAQKAVDWLVEVYAQWKTGEEFWKGLSQEDSVGLPQGWLEKSIAKL